MAGVPTLNAAQRAHDLSLLRDQMAADPGIATKMLQGLYSAATLPGDVYQGNREATPEAGMEFALNMAGASTPFPKPTNSIGIFGGPMAKTANHNMKAMAEAMEAAGSPADTIWEATGWGKGKDGQWRFEIDDSRAHLWSEATDKIHAGMTLDPLSPRGGGFSHPELYEAYPELKNTIVSPDKSGNYGTYYGKGLGNKHDIALKPQFRSKMQSTLLHELQHAVQNIEGFAKGGNSGMFKDIYDHAKVGRIAEARNLAYARIKALNERVETLTAQERREWDVLHNAYNKLGELHMQVKGRGISPYDQYKALAGETEARNVQTRESWDAQKRSDVPPEFSEDVPRSKQKVIYR
jgi:hypothetical protein